LKLDDMPVVKSNWAGTLPLFKSIVCQDDNST
jgi:hypothetical protein